MRKMKKEKIENPYLPELVKIEKITKETEDTKTIRLRYAMEHKPGQFMQISLFGIGEAPFVICSSEKNHIEFCIRNVGNVTNALLKLKLKDKIGIRGPYGNGYPIEKLFKKNIIIIAGGTGLASPRALIQHIEHNKDKFGDVQIFLGFRTPDDILFRKDTEEWKKRFSLELTVDKAENSWKGNVGLITELIEKAKINKENTIVIICGPPTMIKFVVQLLQRIGFTDDQIYISLERLMKCGIGKCGRCMVKGKYVCKDGPVFRYDEAKLLED